MKKLIVKTACITLAAVIGLSLMVYGFIALFSPVTLAKAYDKLGMYNKSVKYYEIQYNKSLSKNDLLVLCLKCDQYSDGQRTQKYLDILISNSSYVDICNKIDEQEQEVDVTTEEVLDGKFVCAVYKSRGLSTALAKAKQCVTNSTGYTTNNPFFMLYADEQLNLTKQQLAQNKSELDGFYLDLPTAIERTRARNDLANLTQIIDSMK